MFYNYFQKIKMIKESKNGLKLELMLKNADECQFNHVRKKIMCYFNRKLILKTCHYVSYFQT